MDKEYKKYDGDLLLTTACPVECDYCVYSCSPEGEWMPEDTIRRVAFEYTENEVGIRISGGEPFLDLEKLERCIKIVLEYQKPHEVLIISSGFFGSDEQKTQDALEMLTEYKLDTLVLSVDRFHLGQVPLSSIENIVVAAKKFSVKIIIRLTTDETDQSYKLMDEIAYLVMKRRIKIEPHHQYGAYGKAEILEPCLRENKDKREDYMRNAFNGKLNKYKEQSPKRSQRDFASSFYPTTFPNGNTYADSQCTKGSFMGNLMKKHLKEMIVDFKKTLPGYILLSDKSDCSKRMPVLLPESYTDRCDYCRNNPRTEDMPKEAIGRQLLVLKAENIDKKKCEKDRELLLSVQLDESDLNTFNGRKIISFVDKLVKKNKRFVFSRPIPRCVLGRKYAEFIDKYNMPRDCYECRELFFVINQEIVSCKPLSKKGPKIQYMEDRNQIWEFFKILREEKGVCNTCKKCIYYIRKKCDGLCFIL
ncbi:radical SAM protein [Candidatus Woesearchaeota archaeon]|nr:radical SAM protein [Candidatus Woesearchaeota archaeon]